MKKLLATFAVCMAFSMPAMAMDFTLNDTQTNLVNNSNAIEGYMFDGMPQSKTERVTRLVNEMLALKENGEEYSYRWNVISTAAAKEGWDSILDEELDSSNGELADEIITYLANLAKGPTSITLIDNHNVEPNADYEVGNNSGNSNTTHSSVVTTWNGKSTVINGHTIIVGSKSETIQDLQQRISRITDAAVEDAIDQAYNLGWDDGYDQGFRDGWQAAETHYGIN